jgi:flagellar biosynthesis protein FlhG
MVAEPQSNLFAEGNAVAPILLSFAAPTGGVGTTLLAANLGIHLAKKGKSVLLADLALTEAACHLALGILRPERHIGQWVSKAVPEVREAILPTSVNNLSLLAGMPDLPEVANLAYLTKQKILGALADMPYDYVLIDAGSGTGADTLDFFLAGRYSIAVMQATPVGVEPFYRFLRAALRRLLIESLNKKRYQALAAILDPKSPLDGFWEAPETREEDLVALEGAIRNHRLCFVQTGLSAEKDVRLGPQLESLIRRYFLCPVRSLGALEWDVQASAASRVPEPIAKGYPMCAYSLAVEKLANVLLKEEKEPRAAEGHLTRRQWGDLDAYQLLEVPTNATAKDIQAAYAKVLEPYLESSPLTLSLYGKEEREAIRDRLEDAYKTLITTSLRQRYDEELIASGAMEPEQRVQEYRDLQADASHSPPAGPSHPPAEPVEDTATRSARALDIVLQEVEVFNGEALRRVREAQGISLAEIVQETNIRSWYLESIEAERFDVLPGLIYLKGFVRQVANYLHLEPERVLRDYLARYEVWLKGRES